MLKRINPDKVRLGMFIEAIEGSWVDNPWRRRFLLDKANEVEKLKSSTVEAVVINTAKGADVASLPVPREQLNLKRQSMHLRRALETVEHAKPLVREMFEHARLGAVRFENATEAVEHIANCMTDSARTLIEITRLKSRDEYTFLHSIAVSALMVHLARAVDMDEQTVRDLGMGGLVHDIGKARLKLDVLNKSGPLDEHEMRHVRTHPSLGYELLARQSDIPRVVLDICLYHHERIDGKGYTKGLTGDQLSVPVRISTICDVYDALTTKRAYKKACAPVEAARFMLEQEGQFDRRLLMRFFHSLDM